MHQPRTRYRLLLFMGIACLLLSAPRALAQTETWIPATSGFSSEIRVWTSNGQTYAKVRLVFPNGGYRVDWGRVTRSGNTFIADARIEKWTGASIQMITFMENTYSLGALEPGQYNFVFRSFGTVIKSQEFDPSLVVERWEPAILAGERVGIRIWGFNNGATFAKVELYFPDTSYSVIDWGTIARNGNEFSVDIKTERFTGESQARTVRVDHDYQLGTLAIGAYTLVVKMYGTTVKTQPFSVEASTRRSPRLLTEENSERAIALDSVTWLRQFSVITSDNFSTDRRARIMLFVTDVEPSSGEQTSSVTAYAEDAEHKIYPLTVEYFGDGPNVEGLKQVVLKAPDELSGGGEIWIGLSVNGEASNKVLFTLKPSASGAQ